MVAKTLGATALAAIVGLAGCQANSDKAPASSPAASKAATTTRSPAAKVSGADRARAKTIVDKMGTAELAGSVIMATYDSSDPHTAANLIADKHLAGVIVMGYNLPDDPSAGAVKKITSTIRDGAGERGWNPTIGIDQEGGPVARLKQAATEYPPLMAAGAANKPKLTKKAYAAQARELRAMGFTADFAPDSDVTIGKADPAINVRSAGSGPKHVSSTVAAAIRGYNAGGIASSAKHFPGHGALTADSHAELPVSKKSIEQMSDRDIPPFRTAAKAGVPMVMVGHIGLPGSTSTPASLNPAAYRALRKQAGFSGVAVTDALNMGAITADNGKETVKALKAGADLALMPPDTDAAVRAVKRALGDGTLEKQRIKKSAERVVAMQLWQQRTSSSQHDVAAARQQADTALGKLSDASVTVLAGKCAIAKPVKSISIVGGSDTGKANLAKAARNAGLKLGGGTTVGLGISSGADVVLGTAGPWVVQNSNADTVLELYSDNPHAMASAVEYLQGKLRATGTAPVSVAGTQPECRSAQ